VIEVEKKENGAVLHLYLAAPKANILDARMVGAIEEALASAGPEIKAVAFEGRGPNFSFGASVPEHTREEAPAMLRRFHGLFRTLGRLGIPTVAIVRGRCLGGGLELAAWCSWIFASPDALLGQPEIKLAVFPPMASILLPWRAGGAAAIDLCVSGRTITAAEAQRLGLVAAVADDPAAHWQSFFREHISPLSASSLRFAERAARSSLLDALENRLPAIERLYIDELMATPDANEGIASFIEKRPAAFGRH